MTVPGDAVPAAHLETAADNPRSLRARVWAHHRISSIALLALGMSFGGKALGLARELLISTAFGVSYITDLFFALQQLPAITSSYIFGAFTLVFVPHYADRWRNGVSGAFLRTILQGALIVGFGLTIIFIIFRGSVATWLGVADGPYQELFVVVLALTIPAILATGLAFGVLHAEGRPVRAMALAALGPAAMLIVLAAILLLMPEYGILALPISFACGTFAAAVWAAPLLFFRVRGVRSEFREMGRFFGQLGASSLENIGFTFNQLTNVYFAASSMVGGVSALTFASRLALFPLNAVASPVNQLLHSKLSRSQDKRKTFLTYGPRIALIFLAMAGLIFLFRESLVQAVYERGSFSASDSKMVVKVLRPFAVYLGIISINQLMARYFFATFQGATYTFVMMLGYGIAFILKGPLSADQGVAGVIIACMVGEGMASIALAILIARRGWWRFGRSS